MSSVLRLTLMRIAVFYWSGDLYTTNRSWSAIVFRLVLESLTVTVQEWRPGWIPVAGGRGSIVRAGYASFEGRQAHHARTIRVHAIDLSMAVSVGLEDDELTVGRHGRVGVLFRRVGQAGVDLGIAVAFALKCDLGIGERLREDRGR